MSTGRNLQKYRQAIEEALAELGRDDVGVGAIVETHEGILSVTFSRGTHQHTADIPIDKMKDREETKKTVRSALVALSKAIAQEAIGLS